MRNITIAILISLSIVSTSVATSSWQCWLTGGTMVANECVYPVIQEAPSYYEELDLTEHNWDSLIYLGKDAENYVLAQHETFSISIPNTVRFTKPVNIAIGIKLKGFPTIFVQPDNTLNFYNSWYSYNTKQLDAANILGDILVSEVLGTYKGWILVGIEIRTTDTWYYRFEYYFVYIVNPEED